MSPLLPEITVAAVAGVLLLVDAAGGGRKTISVTLTALALLAAGGLALSAPEGVAYGMVTLDPLARFLKVLLLGAVGGVLALSAGFAGFAKEKDFAWGGFLGLMLFATAGLLLLVSATDFLAVVIALELVSVSSFILVGFQKKDRRASEAAIKYFLFGAFSTGLMLYGVSLFYGLTGSTSLARLWGDVSGLPALPLTGALFFILAGFGFKLALVPFHMWAPDVYEGAPTPVTAFLSVAPKAAAFGLMVRAFQNHGALHLTPLLAVLAALTMTVGNLGALRQSNVKRLLAYSSVAQMGYVLIGFVAAGSGGFQSVLVYLAAYVFMNLGAFAAVLAVGDESGAETLDGFDGLSSRSLPLALATTFFLLSLTGIPPFVGFIGKFSLFGAALQRQGLAWLVVVGAVNSVVSFAYYFSIVRRMFFSPAARTDRFRLSAPVFATLGLTVFVTLAAGLFPDALLQIVRRVWP